MMVSAKDVSGNSYDLRFRFWINNQSRMYLLESMGALMRHYGMKVRWRSSLIAHAPRARRAAAHRCTKLLLQ